MPKCRNASCRKVRTKAVQIVLKNFIAVVALSNSSIVRLNTAPRHLFESGLVDEGAVGGSMVQSYEDQVIIYLCDRLSISIYQHPKPQFLKRTQQNTSKLHQVAREQCFRDKELCSISMSTQPPGNSQHALLISKYVESMVQHKSTYPLVI